MPDEPAEQLFEIGHRMMVIANEVKTWREITSKPNRVEPHSSLAADDALFPLAPVSHLILFGITHAVDHLDMYMTALIDSQLSFPIAPQTLARGGLLGAAHALWMLDEPDRRTRQLRGLRIVHEEWRNERNAYQDLVDRGEAVEGIAQLIQTRREWMGRAVEAGESIGWTKAQVSERPNDTKLIEAVLTRYEANETQARAK